MQLILPLILFLVGFGAYEFFETRRAAYKIAHRIHVNGTRGKSSVTRLIGSGLRESGFQTLTKVTGTYPKLVMEDGTEEELYRRTKANIIEQARMLRYAADRQVDAIVFECMAVQPQFQWIVEHQMVRSTVGVITNTRLDHLGEMGNSLEDITRALCNTIPFNGVVFTSEQKMFPLMEKIAKKRGTQLIYADPETVTDEDLRGFRYVEHRDNVALALAVCQHLGIPREKAMAGLHQTVPDSGALEVFDVDYIPYKRIRFANGFAANDPESTILVYNLVLERFDNGGKRIIVLTIRDDRLERAEQLAEAIVQHMPCDYVLLVGDSTDRVHDVLTALNFPRQQAISMGVASGEEVFEMVLDLTDDRSIVLGIGNMVGKYKSGTQIVNYFRHRSHITPKLEEETRA